MTGDSDKPSNLSVMMPPDAYPVKYCRTTVGPDIHDNQQASNTGGDDWIKSMISCCCFIHSVMTTVQHRKTSTGLYTSDSDKFKGKTTTTRELVWCDYSVHKSERGGNPVFSCPMLDSNLVYY